MTAEVSELIESRVFAEIVCPSVLLILVTEATDDFTARSNIDAEHACTCDPCRKLMLVPCDVRLGIEALH